MYTFSNTIYSHLPDIFVPASLTHEISHLTEHYRGLGENKMLQRILIYREGH